MNKLNIGIVGAGYVGLATGAVLAKFQNDVIFIDISLERIKSILSGRTPIYELGLNECLNYGLKKGYISAFTDIQQVDRNLDFVFICVQTPVTKDNTPDLRYIKNAAKSIGTFLKRQRKYAVVVVKSTILPLTTERTILPILEKYSDKKAGKAFGLCMNPEFLSEGSAVQDTLNPDRIIIGQYDNRSGSSLLNLYRNIKCPKLRVDLRTAETIKYASNVYLATKISYTNEIANICEKIGIDTIDVMKGVGLDKRISPYYLEAGCGFGGSCLPKDLKSFIKLAKSHRYEPRLLESVSTINESQPLRIIELLNSALKDMKGKKVCVLGVAFKPDTDDIRDSKAIPIIKALIERRANVMVYDPKAMRNFKVLKLNIEFAKNIEEALRNADACIIQTAWSEIKKLRPQNFKLMRNKIIIDGRRALNKNDFTDAKIIYRAIGLGRR